MKQQWKIRLFALGLLLLSGISVCWGATIPQLINYQGTLANASGTTLVPDGNYNVEFKIYGVATGGTALWTEKWDGTTSPVVVTGGTFNVMLGTHSVFPAGFFADHPVAYLGVKVGTTSEMLPRQRIASVGYAFAAGNGIPKRGVIMWSGTIAEIPGGWALCDGSNGTPDLRDRFVVGAGGAYTVSSTGGASSVDANHNHTIPQESPGTNATGDHGHHIDVNLYNGIGDVTDGADDGNKEVGSEGHGHHLMADTWGNGTHSHTVNAHAHGGATVTGGATALENRPPYYALAFIMKL